MNTNTTTTRHNGVDVDKLFETIEAIKASPSLAKFKFRANNEWINCGHNRTTVKDFYGTGENINHLRPLVLEADEPELLLGTDKGANPVEHLLHALAGCVTSSMVYHAAARGIEIEECECELEGGIDIQAFLGIKPGARRGYEGIQMKFRIKADVSDEELEELVKLGPTYSPVYDSLTSGTPVNVSVVRK